MDTTLYDWAATATVALELPEAAQWVGERDNVTWVLDLAKDVAHGAMRPAAPVATFLAGVATGLTGAEDRQVLDRIYKQLLGTLAPSAEEG